MRNLVFATNPFPADCYRQSVIRIVKSEPDFYGIPDIAFESKCNIRLLRGGVFEEESEMDYFFTIEHEQQSDECLVRFSLCWPQVKVGHVICERQFIPFEEVNSEFRFEIDLKGLSGYSRTLDVHSYFSEKGLETRIEHNHPLRRSGQYRSLPWPQRQSDSALHYIFASREVIKALEIPSQLADSQSGYIYLMGFESNNPQHGDYPPHWHLIYYWKDALAASQVPHLYLDELGRNTHNFLTTDSIPRLAGHYKADEWCFMKDPIANDVFALMVCSDGGIAITKPGGKVYTVTPYDPVGGVEIYADSEKAGSLRAQNDPSNGSLRVEWTRSGNFDFISASYVESIDYMPLSGDVIQVKRTDLK